MLGRKLLVVALCLAAASAVGGAFAPAFAQRYPPFPIGGGGGTTGAGSTAPQTTSGSGSEFFNPGAPGASGGSGGSSSGTSDADDEPACDLATCLRFAGQVGAGFVTGRAQELGKLRVAAVEGCCQSFARVDVYMESERVFLGTVRATEDGSYAGEFTLPSSIKAGQHHIIADIEGCGELRGAIEVLQEGATVLGTSTVNSSRSSEAGGGGILPRTGGDVLRVILWALILVAFGTLLIVGARRFAPARVQAGRAGRGVVAALPPPEVPFVDTSRFVPYRSAPGQRIAGSGRSTRTPRARPAPTTQRTRTTSAWDRAPKNESPS